MSRSHVSRFPTIWRTGISKRSKSFSGAPVSSLLVVAVNLFVDVWEQVERLHADVRALQAALRQNRKFSMPFVWTLPRTYSMAWSTTWCSNSVKPPYDLRASAHHDGFILAARPSDLASLLIGVHIAPLAAHKVSSINAASCQSAADAMVEEPSSLLAHADHAMDFVRTDAVADVNNMPHSHEPHIQADWRILEYGSGLDGELTACMPRAALPAVVPRHERNALAAATWALDTVRPAPGE